MPDSNSFAERQHSASQARAEERYEAYGSRVVESIIDDLLEGREVGGMTWDDFCEHRLTWKDVGALLKATGDARIDKHHDLKLTVERHIRQWCEGRGSAEVNERVKAWEEADRTGV